MLDITLIEQDSRWQSEAFTEACITNIVDIVLSEVLGRTDACIELSIVLTDDKTIAEMNKNFRHKNNATNVLSFIQYSSLEEIRDECKESNEINLGDIIFAFDTISEEAKQQNKLLQHHLKHLLIHGVLHLLGFDHIDDGDAELMAGLEIKALASIGIENPY